MRCKIDHMARYWKNTFAVFCVSLAIGFSATSAQTSATPGWQPVHLTHDGQAYDFPVYANHPLDGDLSKIEHVLFIQHGIRRNGEDYYATGMRLLRASGIDPATVLIVAPNFPAQKDLAKGFDAMPLWNGGGRNNWAAGAKAVNPPYRIGALDVLDDLLSRLTDKARLPALMRVTLAGHSAGAQLMQRYAVLNEADEAIRARGIALRYVISSPSSYLYFTPERPQGASFAIPDAAQCKAYDRYRYGLQRMIPYGRSLSGMDLFQRYAKRNVTYLLGTADNDPNHPELDKRCGAQLQGDSRLTRGQNYERYERYLAGSSIPLTRTEYEVIGVGHNQRRMFGSQCGQMALFGAVANGKAAACRS